MATVKGPANTDSSSYASPVPVQCRQLLLVQSLQDSQRTAFQTHRSCLLQTEPNSEFLRLKGGGHQDNLMCQDPLD